MYVSKCSEIQNYKRESVLYGVFSVLDKVLCIKFKKISEIQIQRKCSALDIVRSCRKFVKFKLGENVLVSVILMMIWNIFHIYCIFFLGRESKKNGVVLNKYSILVFRRILYTLYSLSIVQLYSV